jgi:crossover junction endodeoxyribonuclease RuvC
MYSISEVQEQEGAIAVVEKVGAMPKQGLSSTWVFAENFGYIQGVLHALSIPFQLVPPRVWKKSFSLTSDKAKSIEVCHRLFPNVSLKRTDKSHNDDNNLAEALLMAEYARRIGGDG